MIPPDLFIHRSGESGPRKHHVFCLSRPRALEKLRWIPFMLAVPEYNKWMLNGKVDQVKSSIARFSLPYSQRIAGEHTHLAIEDYKK